MSVSLSASGEVTSKSCSRLAPASSRRCRVSCAELAVDQILAAAVVAVGRILEVETDHEMSKRPSRADRVDLDGEVGSFVNPRHRIHRPPVVAADQTSGIQRRVGTVGDGRRDSLDRYGELGIGTARLVERDVPVEWRRPGGRTHKAAGCVGRRRTARRARCRAPGKTSRTGRPRRCSRSRKPGPARLSTAPSGVRSTRSFARVALRPSLPRRER